MSQAVYDYDEDIRTPQDYLAILKRRKYYLVFPAALVAAIALMVTFALPAIYTSQATILIEEQEVPREFVTSTITSFAAQQIQVISQRVLTAESISRVADKYGLYTSGGTGKRPPATQIAQAFRDSMQLDLVSADVIDPRSGQARKATIAFTLAFEHGDPSTAQKVTNELVTLFLNENLRTRAERVANTEAFLAAEADSLGRELGEIESRLADFKRSNQGALPELHSFNLSSLERTTGEISSVDIRLKELAMRKLEVSAELAQMNPWATVVSSTGTTLLGDEERLKALRAEYRQKSAVYKSNHPDVLRLQREIERLEVELGSGETREELAEALSLQEQELADLQTRYRDDSVQVLAARRQVEDLQRKLAEAPAADAAPAAARAPDNPAYILLDTQRKSMLVEEAGLLARRQELQAKIARLEGLVSQAPTVEKDYSALLRDYDSARSKYQEIRAKQRQAELAENMEQDRKGERFLMVEPPNLPLEPSSPNRPALALVGLILSIGAGMGMVVLMELIDSAVHGEKQLAKLTGAPPFAVVTYIENTDDREAHARRLKRVLIAAGIGVLVFVVFFHFYIKPLDVAWFMLMKRLGF